MIHWSVSGINRKRESITSKLSTFPLHNRNEKTAAGTDPRADISLPVNK